MIENIIIKNTTKCDCGREFIITDIQKLERVNNQKFYSGVVKHYSRAKCPRCDKKVILLLKQVGQTYEVINVAYETDKKNESIDKVEKIIPDIKKNELICSICKKECKSKSGLLAHMRTHKG